MSSAVVSTLAALGRPFLFDDESEPVVSCHPERSGKSAKRISCGVEEPALSLPKGSLPDPRLASITAASRLEIRPAPEMVTTGISALDALTGGLPRGCLTEIYGPASSGRASVMLAALASATRHGEYCALIDASDALDPHSLAAAGVDLDRLLWVRCGESEGEGAPSLSPRFLRRQGGGFDFPSLPLSFQKNDPESPRRKASPVSGNSPRHSERRLEQALRATDLLLESGGFGLIIMDLSDIPPQSARRIPLTTWFRFRRAVEHKPTILLAIEQQPIAGSCSSLLLKLESPIAPETDCIKTIVSSEPAAQRRKNAAHACPERSRRGASRGLTAEDDQAPEGRKKNCAPAETLFEACSPSHANLLTELKLHAELIRSRLDRKPARSIAFETKTAWAG